MQSIELRLKKLVCEDETNPEPLNSDEILLSGISLDATGDSAKLGTYSFDGLDDGDQRDIGNSLFASFGFAADDVAAGKATGWPRSYFVTFLLAEQDNGGFPDWVKTIYEKLKGEVVSAVSAAVGAGIGTAVGGAIGAAVGAVCGWLLGELFVLFKEWWEDDPFPPVVTRCDISSPFMSFGDDDAKDERLAWTSAHGGRYRIEYDWVLRGVPATLGIFDGGDGKYALWRSSWQSFTKKWDELSKSGLRLIDIGTYVDGEARVYAGVFRHGNGGHFMYDLDWNAFEGKRKELLSQGFHVRGLDAYRSGTTARVVATFLPGQGNEIVVRGSWDDFITKWTQLGASRMRLDRVSSYYDGSTQIFVGVFHEGDDGHLLWSSHSASFLAKAEEAHKSGLRLRDVATFVVGGARRYVGAWRSGNQPQYVAISADWVAFDKKWKAHSASGRRLVSIAV